MTKGSLWTNFSTLIVSHGGSCVRLSFSETDQRMFIEHPDQFQGCHEEADTLIAFHASNVNGSNIICASDTDLLVILIGMLGRDVSSKRPRGYKQIIMDCGWGNTLRYIDVSHIANSLESKQK